MGSLPSEGLDETQCLWAMCPHPCCWDSEQRIARGIPRHTKSCTSDPGRAAPVEEVSTLSVVNVSEWTEGRKPMRVKLLFKTLSREDATADAPLTVLSSQSQSQQGEHSESADLHFPRNFVVHTSPQDGKQKKGVKLSTAQIKPLASVSSESCGSGSLVMWIPNPQHTPQCHSQNRSSPLVAVKELFCLPSSQSYKSARLHRKKLKPVRKRVRFQLTPQQGSEVGSGSPVAEGGAVDPAEPAEPGSAQPDPDRDGQGEEEEEEGDTTLQVHVQVQTSPRPPSAPRAPSAFLLRNKPVVLHSVRERILRRNTQPDPPVYKYKLDTETSVQDINWEKLRRQTYLWRKRNAPAGRDKEKPEVVPVSQPDQQWDSFGFYPVAKATLHFHPTSPLSIGPAVWQCVNCAKGMWPGQCGVVPSKSKCHHPGLSSCYLALCNSDVCLNPVHRLYRDDVSDVDLSKGAIAPYNSMLYLQEPALQDSDSGGVDSGFGREGGRGVRPGAPEQTGSSADDKPTPGSQPSPPPSSLNSDSCGDGRP